MLEGVKLSSQLTPVNTTQWKNRRMWPLDVPSVAAIGTNNRQGIATAQPCSANVITSATRAELMTGLTILAAAQTKLLSQELLPSALMIL